MPKCFNKGNQCWIFWVCKESPIRSMPKFFNKGAHARFWSRGEKISITGQLKLIDISNSFGVTIFLGLYKKLLETPSVTGPVPLLKGNQVTLPELFKLPESDTGLSEPKLITLKGYSIAWMGTVILLLNSQSVLEQKYFASYHKLYFCSQSKSSPIF